MCLEFAKFHREWSAKVSSSCLTLSRVHPETDSAPLCVTELGHVGGCEGGDHGYRHGLIDGTTLGYISLTHDLLMSLCNVLFPTCASITRQRRCGRAASVSGLQLATLKPDPTSVMLLCRSRLHKNNAEAGHVPALDQRQTQLGRFPRSSLFLHPLLRPSRINSPSRTSFTYMPTSTGGSHSQSVEPAVHSLACFRHSPRPCINQALVDELKPLKEWRFLNHGSE